MVRGLLIAVSLCFLSLDLLPTFHPLCFQGLTLSPSSFTVKMFAGITASGTSSFFCHNHAPSLKLLWEMGTGSLKLDFDSE